MSLACATPLHLPRSISCSNVFWTRTCSRDDSESPVQASRYRIDSRPSLEVDSSNASLRQQAQRNQSMSSFQPTSAQIGSPSLRQIVKRENTRPKQMGRNDAGPDSSRKASGTFSIFEHKRKTSGERSANVFGYSTTTAPSRAQQHSRGGSDGTATTTTKSVGASSIFSRNDRSSSNESQGSAHTRNTSASSGTSGSPQLRRKQAFTGLNTAQPEPTASSAFPSERTSSSESRGAPAGPHAQPRKSSISTMLSKAKESIFGGSESDKGTAVQDDSTASFASVLHAGATNPQELQPHWVGKRLEPTNSVDTEVPRPLKHQLSLLDFRFHFERSRTSAALPTPDQELQYKYNDLSVQQTPERAYGGEEAPTQHSSNSSASSMAGADTTRETSFPSSAGTILHHTIANEESNISSAVLDPAELERSNVTLRTPLRRRRTSTDTTRTVLHHTIVDREESGWATIDSDDEGCVDYEEV